jgi:hypothetical protein
MNHIVNIIKNLEGMRSVGGASEVQIAEAEKRLQLHFAEEYKEYLTHFGAISSLPVDLMGLNVSPARNVTEVTLEERKLNASMPLDMYVIEDLGIEGILILQDGSGAVYQLGGSSMEKISVSLREYLESL